MALNSQSSGHYSAAFGECLHFTAFVVDIRSGSGCKTPCARAKSVWRDGARLAHWNLGLATSRRIQSISPHSGNITSATMIPTLTNDFEAGTHAIHEDDRQRTFETLQAALKGTMNHLSTTCFCIEMALSVILSRGCVIRDGHGVASRMVAIHIDTTDRKRTEEELRAAEKKPPRRPVNPKPISRQHES